MYIDFIAGWLGGMIGVIIGHPLDTIKVNLQIRGSTNPHYTGVMATFIHLLDKDGFKALYRGVSSPLVGLGIMNAVLFGIYGSVLRMMPDPDSLLAISVAGTASAIPTAFVVSPVEMTKSRIQVAGRQAGKNPLDCLLILLRKEGIYKGVFKGLGLTMFREIPSNVSYFAVFEYLMPKDQTNIMFHQFMAGGTAGVVSWVLPYPVDVIKSKIQVDGARGVVKYSSLMDCINQTIEIEGYKGFYRGMVPTVIRAFPVNGATFLFVHLILRWFKADDHVKHINNNHVKDTSNISRRY